MRNMDFRCGFASSTRAVSLVQAASLTLPDFSDGLPALQMPRTRVSPKVFRCLNATRALAIALLFFLSPQVFAASFLERPDNVDDADWRSLQGAVAGSMSQQVRLHPNANGLGSDGASGDQLGYAVAMSEDTAIVTAPGDDVGHNYNQGSAYVYVRNGAVWSLQAKLTASDGGAGDRLGISVALSDDTVLIGSTEDNIRRGSVYVFVRSGGTWTEQTKLAIATGSFGDLFGGSVSMSGETAVVGAYLGEEGVHGAAYVYTRVGNAWSLQATLRPTAGTFNAVTISGDTILAADMRHDLSRGVVYVYVRDGANWSQQDTLTIDDSVIGSYLGVAIDVSGDTAILGALRSEGDAADQGAAYVFTRSGADWTQQAKLRPSDGMAFDQFGVSVALEGNKALIGAITDQNGLADQGSAYVFSRAGNSWAQQARFIADDGMGHDQFGHTVALSGEYAVVGTQFDSNFGFGSANVYALTGSTWTSQYTLTAGESTEPGSLGYSVALSGDTAIIGAPHAEQGWVYVFVRNGDQWSLQARLAAAEGSPSDQFGVSVALDGDTALVGAWKDDIDFIDQGSVHVYTRSGTIWTRQAILSASAGAYGDSFGTSVAVHGDTAIVGAVADDGNLGSAYVFVRSGTSWNEQAKLTADGRAQFDAFGITVAVENDLAIVGASGDDVTLANQGSVHLFTRSGEIWNRQAPLTATDAAMGDGFGLRLALSGDTVVIGSKVHEVDFWKQGSAYVFVRNEAQWSQQAILTASDASSTDHFGSSIALSGDTVMVGAYGDNAGQGSAYVYTRSGTDWQQKQKLTPSGGSIYEAFGFSVAISGDYALVGAPSATGATPYGNPNEGAAYVFTGLLSLPGSFANGFE